MLQLIWLIPLLPLAGFLINGLFGRRLSRQVVYGVACGTVLVAFLISVGAVWQLGHLEGMSSSPGFEVDVPHKSAKRTLYSWIPPMPMSLANGGEGEFTIEMAFRLDPLSSVLLLVVTGVGFLIHVYSTGYMEHEENYVRFFAYLNLFMAMMLTLVLGANLPLLFVGWEGVGLCSYLLIGFYYDQMFDEQTKMSCADAGRKAFLVNRVGDMGFVVGMLLIVVHYGTFDLAAIAGADHAAVPAGVLTAIGIALFIGACGKSAQLPLYVWLPDAMAGPTPVSALIHAATMVTAGVYMVCRLGSLYLMAPTAMTVVATVGAATALFAATIGLAQTDIKKVLAYSTVSQLGYMFLAAGVGAFGAAIFHLMTHAFFKALLFLGSGSVIHALHGEQDMRKMGGLWKHLPVTGKTFLVGTVAIAGVFPFAGFFSKDEILYKAFSSGHKGLYFVGLLAAVMTSFYMMRAMALTFWGEMRVEESKRAGIHESPRSMAGVLIVLAVLSTVGGFLGVPEAMTHGLIPNFLEHWLEPSLPHAGGHGHHGSVAVEYALAGLALSLSLAGLFAAYHVFVRKPELSEQFARTLAPIRQVLIRKYYVDEIYDAVIVQSFYRLCRFFRVTDEKVVDGIVNGTSRATLGLSYASHGSDRFIVDGLVRLVGHVVQGGNWLLRRLQTGVVPNYALAMVFGLFVLVTLVLYVD